MQKSNGNLWTKQKPERRRRLIHFGPGIIVALILATVIGGNAVKKDMQRRQAPSGSPIIERHVITSNIEQNGPIPEIEFLLDRRGKLGLSSDQAEKLHVMQSEWKSYYEPKLAEANAAARQLQDSLASAEKRKSTPAAQIQSEAGPMVAVSGEMSAKRREYWDRAMHLLSPKQRDAVLTERKTEQAARQKAMKDSVAEATRN